MDSVQRNDESRQAMRPVALYTYLDPIMHLLTEETTDLCINRPGECWVETSKGWTKYEIPALTLSHLENLAKTASNAARKKLDRESPILSAALPTGERIQVVLPPATANGYPSFTIRKPSQVRFTLDDYERLGFFSKVRIARNGLLEHEVLLKEHLEAHRLGAFFRLAVASKQTILVSGATGSGKTTFMKALVDLIPREERLVTIEDAPELDIELQPNHVRLFYSKDGAGPVTSKDCLEACMRMKPDRILQAEVRDSAAFHFISGSNSGHPGSITSIHANSERDAFGRLAFLMGADPQAASMTLSDLMSLITSTVDIVVQVGRAEGLRAATGIYYDPDRKLTNLG